MSRVPNYIIILTDDQGYADVGCYGSRLIRTPNLDRLAATGMCFTDFYAQPICGPSRAALMTGCYPLRVAERGNVKHIHPVLHEQEITLAEYLKPLGYATAMIGKWDLAGHQSRVTEELQMDLLPHHRGFDLYFGTPASNDRWERTALLENGDVVEDPIRLDRSTTARYADRAVAFIEQHAAEPFFLYLAPNMPHVELHAGEEFEGRSRRGLYGDVVEELDHAIGRIVETVVRLGIAYDTCIVFASDNGPWLQEGSNGGTAYPLRSGKVSTWEGGPRVPCIMWAPGRIPEGEVCREIATTMDLVPTFASLSGFDLPTDRAIDGQDIGCLLRGQFDAADRDRSYFYYLRTHLQAVRRGKWKLILPRPEEPLWLKPFAPNTHIAKWDDIGVERPILYDIVHDIGEHRDVADEHPQIVESLLALANEARADIGDYDRVGGGARFFDGNERRPDAAQWMRSNP
ncbi:MAG: sulfatase [Spirochaetota bacterium]